MSRISDSLWDPIASWARRHHARSNRNRSYRDLFVANAKFSEKLGTAGSDAKELRARAGWKAEGLIVDKFEIKMLRYVAHRIYSPDKCTFRKINDSLANAYAEHLRCIILFFLIWRAWRWRQERGFGGKGHKLGRKEWKIRFRASATSLQVRRVHSLSSLFRNDSTRKPFLSIDLGFGGYRWRKPLESHLIFGRWRTEDERQTKRNESSVQQSLSKRNDAYIHHTGHKSFRAINLFVGFFPPRLTPNTNRRLFKCGTRSPHLSAQRSRPRAL